MKITQSLRLALHSLASNKMRAGLTMLGIIIGVGAVIALVAAGEGAQAQVRSRFESLGSNLLVITPGGMVFGPGFGQRAASQDLTSADVQALEELVPSAAAIAPQYSLYATLIYRGNNTQTSVLGVTPVYRQVGNWTVERGRFIDEMDQASQARVAVLGASVVENLFGNTVVDPLGKTIRINRQLYQVVGLLASKGAGGFGTLDDEVFIPLSTAQVRFGGTGADSYNSISIQVVSADKIERAKAEINTVLRARHRLAPGQQNDFSVMDQAQIIQMVEQTTQTFTVLLASIAAISLVVGGIGIMNIMLVSVTERTREIGIRMAVGAKRRHILVQFLSEAVVLSLAGGLLGVLLGYGGAQVVSQFLGGATALVTPSSVMMALSVSVSVGLFFGLYPAYRAAKLKPIVALRYE